MARAPRDRAWEGTVLSYTPGAAVPHAAAGASLTDVVPFVFLLMLLWLVVFGPGLVSLDRVLGRWLRPREEPVAAAA